MNVMPFENTWDESYINISDLEVFCYHGVYKEERNLGQRYLVSADIYYDFNEVEKKDDVLKAINYVDICNIIKSYMLENTYNLIETLSYKIAYLLMTTYKNILQIKVNISKPQAPINMHFSNISSSTTLQRKKTFLSLGSNVGKREEFLDTAIDKINKNPECVVERVAKYIETEPYGYINQPKFINTCIEVNTLMSPYELLNLINDIESELGRVRDIRWGPRTLDIDILFYENFTITSERLTIPHKELHERLFVLEPLCEIAPQLVHPYINKTIYQLYMEKINDVK